MTKSQLNAEQARAVHMIVHEHASIFLTGVAGTGKSFTVATAVALLRTLKDATYEIALTAMTGVAACNIGGKTLHGFVGMGLMKEDSDVLCKRVASSKCLRKQWNRISLLVIDEISMMDPCLFSKVDRIARTARGCHTRPFGGLQVVLVGDFLQLSPVGVAEFCFQAESWAELVQHTVYLRDNHRQANDNAFFSMLSRVRIGAPTSDDITLLQSRVLPRATHQRDMPELHSRLFAVDLINENELSKLDGVTETFVMRRRYEKATPLIPDAQRQERVLNALAKNCPAREKLELKVGAMVMLVANVAVSTGLVNGSHGVVTGFVDATPRLPIVRFSGFDNCHVVGAHTWKCEEFSFGTACVTQVPLILAWAVTIHKSQGQTLQRARLTLDRSVFAVGQAYVALSRLQSLDGVYLESFDALSIKASPSAVAFYERIF